MRKMRCKNMNIYSENIISTSFIYDNLGCFNSSVNIIVEIVTAQPIIDRCFCMLHDRYTTCSLLCYSHIFHSSDHIILTSYIGFWFFETYYLFL